MTQIASLPATAGLDDTDLVVVDDVGGAVTAKATVAELRDHIMRPRIVTEATTTRTLQASDDGAIIRCTNAAGCTVTIPADTLPVGFSCNIVRAPAAGAVSIVPAATVTLEKPASAVSPVVVAEAGATAAVVLHDATAAANVAMALGALG